MKHLVVIGGLAELVAGSMSMAFGAYLAELTEQQRYDSEAKRVKGKLREQGDNHDEEIKAILAKYRVGKSASLAVAEDLRGGDHRRTKVGIQAFIRVYKMREADCGTVHYGQQLSCSAPADFSFPLSVVCDGLCVFPR